METSRRVTYFKLADLKSAPHCTITRTKRLASIFTNLGNLRFWTGSIFKVKEQNNVYVIFNEPLSELFIRLLTKYHGFRLGFY